MRPKKKEWARSPMAECMAVSVQFVFADESHREAWLKATGMLPHDDDLTPGGPLSSPANAVMADYQARKSGSTLIYAAPNVHTSPKTGRWTLGDRPEEDQHVPPPRLKVVSRG